MLMFGWINVNSKKKKNHFYTLPEWTPIIGIINNQRTEVEGKKWKMSDQWIKPWLEGGNQQKQSSRGIL